MCSNGVWQLERLLVRYCDVSGGSKGVRDFISRDLAAFATANPQLSIELSVSRNKAPVLRGEYVCGNSKVIDVHKAAPDVVAKHAQYLRDSSGQRIIKVTAPVRTATPSVQGHWRTSTSFEQFSLRV